MIHRIVSKYSASRKKIKKQNDWLATRLLPVTVRASTASACIIEEKSDSHFSPMIPRLRDGETRLNAQIRLEIHSP